MKTFLRTCLPLAVVVCLSGRPSCANTFGLDQSFTAGNDLGVIINDCCAFVGQTYTVGLMGMLAGVSVDIVEFSGNSFPIDVQIRTVMGGLPTTTILGETSTSAFTLGDVITFPPDIAQVPGVGYAIVVDLLGAPAPGPGHGVGFWSGATGNLYPRGDSVASFDGGVTWVAIGPDNFDAHFKTYVTPEPSPLLLMTSGLPGLAAFWRLARGREWAKRKPAGFLG